MSHHSPEAHLPNASVIKRLRGAATTIELVKSDLICLAKKTTHGSADMIITANELHWLLNRTGDGLYALIGVLATHAHRRGKKRHYTYPK